MNILVIDDHKLLATLVENYLKEDSRISRVDSIQNTDLIDDIDFNKYQIVFLDIYMPNSELVSNFIGLDILKKIKKSSKSKVLMISTHYDFKLIKTALDLGADGYLTKNVKPYELVNAIDYISYDRKYLSSEIKKVYMNPYDDLEIDLIKLKENLSNQQLDILFKLSEGMTEKEVAKSIGKSVDTINYHKKALLKKFNVDKTQKMLKIAVQHNIIQ